MKTELLTTITRADGYQYVGHWSPADTAAVLMPGEIAVTEHVAYFDRMAFANDWFDLEGYMPHRTDHLTYPA